MSCEHCAMCMKDVTNELSVIVCDECDDKNLAARLKMNELQQKFNDARELSWADGRRSGIREAYDVYANTVDEDEIGARMLDLLAREDVKP